jgi:hypothetical protein
MLGCETTGQRPALHGAPLCGHLWPCVGHAGGMAAPNRAAQMLAADAVAVEPVSTLKFPANREINREFRRIRLLGAILKADMRANSEACNKIPYSTEQGIFAKEQGILYARTGNFNGVKWRVISG